MVTTKSSDTSTFRPFPAETPDTRATILRAAVSIIDSHGATALTVRSVAAAAGCSTTGVYTWFGGKNKLVEAIFLDGFRRFGGTLDRVGRGANELDRVALLGAAYRRWALANPTHYVVMFGHAVPDYQPSAEARSVARATFDGLVNAVADSIRVGSIDGEPFEIANHLWAAIHGYVSLELAGMAFETTAAARKRTFDAGMRRLITGCLVPTD